MAALQVQPLRVLLAEDSQTQAFQLRSVLEDYGYAVTVVSNGRDALAALHESRADLVISDVQMPVMNGYELSLAIKNDPELNDLPVILLTNLNDLENVVTGLRAKADVYLTKPCDPEYLLAKMDMVLSGTPAANVNASGELQVQVGGRAETIDADREQILNLLVSTYEGAIRQNEQLRRTEAKLQELNAQLQQRAEALRQSELNFRFVLESNVDPTFVIGDHRDVLFANSAGISFLGVFGILPSDLFPYAYRVGEILEVALPGNPGGTAEVRAFQTQWQGASAHLVFLRDITKRKLAENQIRLQQEQLRVANERLQELASTDPLTGLRNRRSFNEALQAQLIEAQRGGDELSLAMIDVDFFKKYNDTFGHPAGDEVLRGVAKLLREGVRAIDVVGRHGGEEFAILFARSPLEVALGAAERLRSLVEQEQFPNRKVTVSIGLASIQEAGCNADALVAAADAALYQAKSLGRNRVVCVTPSGRGAC
jgi:two-component system cell cycle response regulator